MRIEMNRYRVANFVQIAAFHRAVYSFVVLVMGLFLRSNNVISGDWVRPILLGWQFLLCSAIPMLLVKSSDVEERVQTSPNLGFVHGFFRLTWSFFQTSPISNKVPYRAFRAFLGTFLLLFSFGLTIMLAPLIAFELLLRNFKFLIAKRAG